MRDENNRGERRQNKRMNRREEKGRCKINSDENTIQYKGTQNAFKHLTPVKLTQRPLLSAKHHLILSTIALKHHPNTSQAIFQNGQLEKK